jgi:4-amino-4-deoxy-L-arabinose transferase-like glycosyltransferase
VTETTAPIAEDPRTTTAARIGWAILILATLYVSYFSHLGAIGFVGPDEPRYAWIARDMAETGDWVTPRLYGKPWFEKPPLFYWGAALCFKLFGVGEAAARLPSAISALLATLALAWLALRLYGAETARWLLLLLPSTIGMIGFSHAAATDMPFSAMLTIAMVCAAVVLGLTQNENSPILRQTPWLGLILFGFFLGLAVLAKGPAAIILCGGAVFFWAVFTKRRRDAFRLFHPAALASFCLTALPWYILCARRNQDFLRIFIIEHNFKRFLTPEFQHIQPFWFYGPVLLIVFLPWTAIFLWSLVTETMRSLRARTRSDAVVLFLSWIGFCVAFFTVSKSKLPGYILPAVPASGLLLAKCSSFHAAGGRKSFGIFIVSFGFALMGLVGFIYVHFDLTSPGMVLVEILGLTVLMMSLANLLIGAGFLCPQGSQVRRLLLVVGIVPILFAQVYTGRVVPKLRLLVDEFSARGLADEISHLGLPASKIALYGGVRRDKKYALNYYLRTELKDWAERPDLEAYVLSGSYKCSDLEQRGFQCAEVRLGTPWFMSHILPSGSAGGLPRGGQPQQEK